MHGFFLPVGYVRTFRPAAGLKVWVHNYARAPTPPSGHGDDHDDDDDARTYARTALNARCVRTHVSETICVHVRKLTNTYVCT